MTTHNIQIPILIGDNYRHVMGKATVEELEHSGLVIVTLEITTGGQNARDLVALMTSGEPQALQFVAIPVRPGTTKSKENL